MATVYSGTPSVSPKNAKHLGIWLTIAAVLLVVGYALFGETLGFLLKSFQKPEFSHGYIIPLISGWIIWQRRELIWARRTHGAWTGGLVVGVGIAMALFCHAANLILPPYVALIVVLLGLPAAMLGWASARLLLVPLGFLLFAYPIPDYLYVELSTTLQLISSEIGAATLSALGVPIFLDGNIIDLGVMKLQVAEACSGLRYLLPLITFGVLCAFMYRAPLWAKALVVLATVPLAIVLNGLRIAATGLIVNFGSIELAEGFMHLFEGWVVFLLALAILFGLMFALLRVTGWRGRFADMLDFDRMAGQPGGRSTSAAVTTVAPSASSGPSRPLVASVAALTIAALLLIPLAARPHVIPDRPGLFLYPMQLGEHSGVPSFLDPTTEDVLGADDYLLTDFSYDDATVNLWVAYYDSLINGRYFHSPTTCLPGAGWEYVELGEMQTDLVSFSGRQLVVNRGVVVKGEHRMIMYFWMELRGRSVADLQYVKFLNLWDSLQNGRSDGALIRLYTSLQPGEDVSAGDERLLHLLEQAYSPLEPHVGA